VILVIAVLVKKAYFVNDAHEGYKMIDTKINAFIIRGKKEVVSNRRIEGM
jgi:hypothetical protein